MEKLCVLRIEQEVGTALIFQIERPDDLFQPNVPNDEKEPISCDELALADETWLREEVVRYLGDWPAVRTVLLQVSQEVRHLDPLQEVMQVVKDEGVEADVERGDSEREGDHSSRLIALQSLLLVVATIELGLNRDVIGDELELGLALTRKHLDHQVVELLGVHRLKDLIFHVSSRLP